MEQAQNKKISLILTVLLLAILFGLFGVHVKAFAEETNNETIEVIIEQSYLFGFKKGEDETRGRYMTALFFVSDEVYNENYSYGVVIFPQAYMDKFNVHSDYMNGLSAQGKPYLDVKGASYQQTDGGKVFKCGIARILDQNVSRTFAFIGYVKDDEDNTAYTRPFYADYNSLIAKELTNEEVIELLEQTKSIKSNFGGIVGKISELVDSIWIYLVIACFSVVVIWGAYIGIRLAVAKKNEQKADAQGMVKRLVIGIVIMFVLAGALPLLIKGLAAWV